MGGLVTVQSMGHCVVLEQRMKIRLMDVIPFRIWTENGNQVAHDASHVPRELESLTVTIYLI